MCLHAVSQVPTFSSAIHSMIELHEEQKAGLHSEVAAPKFLELLCEFREFCRWVIKDRIKFLEVTAPWQASPWKECICIITQMLLLWYLYYYTDVTPLTSQFTCTKQFNWQCKAETVFLLSWQTLRLMMKGENSKAAKDATVCWEPACARLFQGTGHSKIC